MSERVVLGFGGTVDYEVAWDASVIEDLARHHGITVAELSRTRTVANERDLVVVLLALMRDGAGGEWFVPDRAALLTFANRFTYRVTLGGTNTRAAIALATLNVPSTVLLVSIDDDVRELLPAGVDFRCGAAEDSTDPHVILQFPAGARVRLADGVVVSRRPNRIILVNDPPNRELRIGADAAEAIAEAGVVMVSGFNSMQDPDLLTDRIEQVQGYLAGRPEDSIVYYEDAAFHRDDFQAILVDAFARRVDVWSMNEDEAQHHLLRVIDVQDPDAVVHAVTELHELVPAPILVVHTHAWALAHGPGAARYGDALRRGVVAASARFVHGDGWGQADFDAIAASRPTPEGVRTAAAITAGLGDDVTVVPAVEVFPAQPTTIGLGDTFAGGFLAGLAALRRADAPAPAHTSR